MNFVENRDARKGLGLGFGGGGGRMEESELEEGEACSFQNHEEDYDASIDPDVDLSYIDEKIQDVLGHFQKDFEGGVSAENLGAKFGGYGSFLPTYQRSPGWGHPRTPSKAHSQNTPRSPAKLQLEGGQRDAVQFSIGTLLVRPGLGSAGSSRLPKEPSIDDGITQDNCMTTAGAEASTSKYESLKPTSISDQKTLKFRIKMGPDNLPTRKNAAIYSGLGLDVSPSSSLDDSPSGSEGMSHEHRDPPFESPASILQIMTSLPMLLSPLTDDHIQLTEKEPRARESTHVLVHMDKPESSGMLLHESNIAKSDKKLSRGKKKNSLEVFESSMDIKGCLNKNTQNDAGVLSRNEQGIDALNTEELVSKTLKLPLLSSSYSFSDDSVKAVDGTYTLKEVNKGMVREKTFSDHALKGCVEPTSIENSFVERTKGGSGDPAQKRLVKPASTQVNGRTKGGLGRKVVGDKVSLHDVSVYTAKDNPEGDKICDSIMGEPNVSKGRTASNTEHTEPPKKSKGSHGTMATERDKQKLKTGTSLVPKPKKSSDGSSTSKNEIEDARVQKDIGKAMDTYRDLFGELEEEDRMDSPEIPYVGKVKETLAVKRGTSAINHGAKERLGGKEVDKPLTSELYPKKATNVQCTENLHGADADNVKGDPVSLPPGLLEDNWVQCDRCHKWRLLPVGTNPDSLPEKWLCSMLNWLPNMNHCSVSEDETTKALITLYQGPPPEGQSNLQNVSASVMVGGTLPTADHPEQYQLNHDLHPVPGAKKKIVRETSNSVNKDGSSQFSSSVKKNLPSSMKSRSLNDVNKSPVTSNSDVLVKKHKAKLRILEHNPDKGDTKNMKAKRRKDPDQDFSRPYNKNKIDGMHSTDAEWISQSGTTRKGAYSSNSNIPTTSVGKDVVRPKDRSSSRDSKYKGNDRLQVSVDITKAKCQGSLDEGSLNLGNHDSSGGLRKRKLKGYQDTHLQESYVDEFSDSREEKKARHSKSEDRESGSSKGSGRTGKKGSHSKNQKLRQNPGSTVSKRHLGGMDCLKMDLGPMQASAAATTSSSSKVSGSHKTKASFQGVKGSPVESVSSSPMRILNADTFTNREPMGKDGFHDTAAVGSPQRCSDGEDDGGSDASRTVRKNKSFTMGHHKPHGSAVLDFQNKGVNHASDANSQGQTLPSPDIPTGHVNGGVHAIGQDGIYPAMEQIKQIKDQCNGEDSTGVCHANVAQPRKIGKRSLLKDNDGSYKLESDAEKVRNTSFPIQLQYESFPSEAKQHKEGKVKLQGKFGLRPDKSEDIQVGKKDYTGNESRKRENQLNREHDFQEVCTNGTCKQEELHAPSQNQLTECDTERSSQRSLSERNDQGVVGKDKLSLPPSGDVTVDRPKVDDALKLQKKQIKKGDYQNGIQQTSSRHPMLNGHRSKELDNPSPIRRDFNSHTANSALKEAKDLKHLADRLKNLGSTLESTGMYFQAALKFLHGASLLESSNNDNPKHNEMSQSMHIYRSTAKLCEFCAHDYEKSKDMAAAALAYKCMEVAYMRVIYSSNTSASRDLQTALQIVPLLGESPSSSASDVDNVNNSTTADKIVLSKSTSSPQVAGTHVIAGRNHPNIGRLLNYAQDVIFAMEASRKSQNAFAAANTSPGEGKYAEGMSSIKMALDFSFQDMEGFLRLVRLATEVIAR